MRYMVRSGLILKRLRPKKQCWPDTDVMSAVSLLKVIIIEYMEKSGGAIKKYVFRSFITGLLLSAGLSFFFHFGILSAYKYLPGSILFLAVLTVLCFLIFWMNIKYDRYLDVQDVFFKTISFNEFNLSTNYFNKLFIRYIRPLNPYIGLLGTMAGLLFALWAVPALIIYWSINPDALSKLLNIAVFFMVAGAGMLFFLACKERFPSIADRITYFAGILFGAVAGAGMLQ